VRAATRVASECPHAICIVASFPNPVSQETVQRTSPYEAVARGVLPLTPGTTPVGLWCRVYTGRDLGGRVVLMEDASSAHALDPSEQALGAIVA
jgi:hypothetical protein